jgi:coenzyme F420-reducing hydrogenase beta subunit
MTKMSNQPVVVCGDVTAERTDVTFAIAYVCEYTTNRVFVTSTPGPL